MSVVDKRPQKLWFILLGAGTLLYFALGAATASHGHEWGDDWAQYVSHAINIATGHAYADIGYLFNADAPHVGPPSYPPGLPLLLAPIVALFGANVFALKIACFFFLALSVPVAYCVLATSFSRQIALAAVCLFALHDAIWGLRESIGSEAPYILFSCLALWSATMSPPPSARQFASFGLGIVVGFLIYGTTAIRSIGVALVPAALIFGWTQRRQLAWFLGLALSFCALILLQRLLLVAPTTYANELEPPTAISILTNAWDYWVALSNVFRAPLHLSRLLASVILLLSIFGALKFSFGSERRSRGASCLRDYMAGIPLFVLYVAAYVAALLLASISPGSRYLLPILPFILGLTLYGGGALARIVRLRETIGIIGAVAFFAAYYAGLHVTSPRLHEDELATCRQCMDMYKFVETHTPPGAVIAFAKPRAMALLAGRRSWAWSTEYSPSELRRRLHDIGATEIVIATPFSAIADRYPASLQFASLVAEPGNAVVFQNSMFRVIDLGEHEETLNLSAQ